MTIHAFDFDGTLTTRDTLLLFIRHARGWWALFGGLLLFSPLLVLMKLHLADNGRTKERLFRHYFRGMLERDFDALCQSFARSHTHVLRTAGLRTVQQALDRGDRVVILSASIDRWVEACLRPFLVSSSQFQVLGTEIEVVDGRLTGRFATPNCYGPEKVRRLKEYLKEVSPRGDVEGAPEVSPRGDVEGATKVSPRGDEEGATEDAFIIAYGDSRGDKELLAYADESHYKPFR
jgi:HAD superfamily phosphoserine phosphatase-like hydrolase